MIDKEIFAVLHFVQERTPPTLFQKEVVPIKLFWKCSNQASQYRFCIMQRNIKQRTGLKLKDQFLNLQGLDMSFRDVRRLRVSQTCTDFILFLHYFSRLSYAQQHVLTSEIFPCARKHCIGFIALFSCIDLFYTFTIFY